MTTFLVVETAAAVFFAAACKEGESMVFFPIARIMKCAVYIRRREMKASIGFILEEERTPETQVSNGRKKQLCKRRQREWWREESFFMRRLSLLSCHEDPWCNGSFCRWQNIDDIFPPSLPSFSSSKVSVELARSPFCSSLFSPYSAVD